MRRIKEDEHRAALEEHERNIKRAIDEGIEENQRNIGYNVSQGAVELFCLYLHKLNLIESSGENFDHRIFKSKDLVEKRIPLSFPERQKILNVMRDIELDRNVVCYGKRKPADKIEKMIINFQKLKGIINPRLEDGKKK